MKISINKTPAELGAEAARFSASRIRDAITMRGEARIVLATGSSQFETLSALLRESIDWSHVVIFHLDEYIGLPSGHKASFRRYLHERFIDKISCREFHGIETEGNIDDEIRKLTREIRKDRIDLGMIGIGENGHIAFNDPPADFVTRDAYIVVNLDEKCRMQQVGEGWFDNIGEVPERAVSMSVWQIMQCRTIVSAVPHAVKAEAVKNTFGNATTNLIPATILKEHPDIYMFLDCNSASGFMKF